MVVLSAISTDSTLHFHRHSVNMDFGKKIFQTLYMMQDNNLNKQTMSITQGQSMKTNNICINNNAKKMRSFPSAISSVKLISLNKHSSRRSCRQVLIFQLNQCRPKQCVLSVLLRDNILMQRRLNSFLLYPKTYIHMINVLISRAKYGYKNKQALYKQTALCKAVNSIK